MSPRGAVGALLAAVLLVACEDAGPRPRPGLMATEPIADAARLRTELRGTEGEERQRARARAVEAYRRVLEDPAAAPATRAQAAFRAAELLRAGGQPVDAAELFERSHELAPDGPFAARALLELGHVHRREQRPQAALAAYERLASDPLADPSVRDRGVWWIGRVESDRARPEDARRAFERVARGAEDPLLRVRACDAWIGLLVADGWLEEAAGVLEWCRSELRPRAAELSELGQRLRRELEAMQAPGLLAAAVAERRARGALIRAERIPHGRQRTALPPPPLGN